MVKHYTKPKNSRSGLKFRIYEGEDKLADNNNFLGELVLPFSALYNTPDAEEREFVIAVKFEMDKNGVLNVSANVQGTNVTSFTSLVVSINESGTMTTEEKTKAKIQMREKFKSVIEKFGQKIQALSEKEKAWEQSLKEKVAKKKAKEKEEESEEDSEEKEEGNTNSLPKHKKEKKKGKSGSFNEDSWMRCHEELLARCKNSQQKQAVADFASNIHKKKKRNVLEKELRTLILDLHGESYEKMILRVTKNVKAAKKLNSFEGTKMEDILNKTNFDDITSYHVLRELAAKSKQLSKSN